MIPIDQLERAMQTRVTALLRAGAACRPIRRPACVSAPTPTRAGARR